MIHYCKFCKRTKTSSSVYSYQMYKRIFKAFLVSNTYLSNKNVGIMDTWQSTLDLVSPCLANRVPKPQPTPPSKTPKKILQAYISGENSEHNHNQNELIEIYTITYQGDSCMKGIWEVLDEGVGGSLPTHLQELLPSCKGEQSLTFKETRPRRQYCCLDRKGPGPHTCLMTILTPSN